IILHVGEVDVLAIAGVAHEAAGKEMGVAQQDKLMIRQVKVHEQIDFLANADSGVAARVATNGDGGRVVQSVLCVIQVESVVLRLYRDPVGGEKHELTVDIVDVLPPHQVDVAKIVVTEGKQLIESVMSVSSAGTA